MYQPYPTGAQMPALDRPPVPPQVINAVRAMYVGAAASVVAAVIEILTVSATRTAIEKRSHHLTASQLNASQQALIIGFAVSGLIQVAAWLFIARNCKNGNSWAQCLYYLVDSGALSRTEKEWILGGSVRRLLEQ